MAKKTLKSKKTTKKTSRELIKGILSGDSIVSGSQKAKDLYGNRLFGEYLNKKITYSLSEALYLVEKKKMEVFLKTKKLTFNQLMDKSKSIDKKIFQKFIVYKDLRDKGYLLKTALKFGADFRVYDKGVKPGRRVKKGSSGKRSEEKGHAKWILYPVLESEDLTWNDFSAKNRVAHSTKKNLLIAIVDTEGSITYYEVTWKRP